MPPSFFICYRREDAGYAAALSNALAQRHGPDRVFKDITSLPLARDWQVEVTAAIGRSTHVLALVGPHWMAGVDPHGQRDGRPDPVTFELAEAARTGRTVVPVLLSGQRMPSAHRLPAPLQWMSALHAAHVRVESADDDIARLVDRLPPPVRGPQRREPDVVPSAPRPPARSGAGRIVGPLVALAVLGALALTGTTLWDRLGGSTGDNEPGPTITPTITQCNEPAPPQDNRAAPPQGDGPSPTKRSLELTPESGTMTTCITATGTGFTPGATVDIEFGAMHAAEAVVGSDGRFSKSFPVPEFYSASPTWTYSVRAGERDTANSATAYFKLNN